jgi:hypothetical protein
MNVADEHAGKKAKCPACGEVVVIPLKSILPPREGTARQVGPGEPPAAVNRKPQRPADDDDGDEDRKPASQVSASPCPRPAKSREGVPEDDDDDIPEVEAVDEDEEDSGGRGG